jgi:signal peptidase II
MSKLSLVNYVLFLLIITIDLMTKAWIKSESADMIWWWGRFQYTENFGFIMGTFHQTPLFIKSMFLSSIGITFSSIYVFLLSYIRFSSGLFRFGLTCLFAGILANVIDRVMYDSVTDFIVVSTSQLAFNIADIFQVIGIVLLCFKAKWELDHFYPVNDQRESGSFIYTCYKSKFTKDFLILFLGLALVGFVLNFIFIRFTLIEHSQMSVVGQRSYLLSYILITSFYHLLLVVLLVLISKKLAKHIYGPIYAIERSIESILNESELVDRELRKDDHFKGLHDQLKLIHEKIKNKPIN